jgi:hypothetical protein
MPLLEGILDYAGLFPPARLPMGEAIESYFHYKNGPEAWIVERFLCPASRLSELRPLLAGRTIEVGVIGTGGSDLDAFETALEADAKAMTAFEERSGEEALIAAFEVRIPPEAADRAFADLRAFSQVSVFAELPWDGRQADLLAGVAEQEWLGAKARTGGLEPTAFPSAGALADFLKGCQDLEVPFKLTAGLHHPLRRFDDALGTPMHGFMNIIAALALNASEDLSSSEMAQILEQESPLWDGGGFEWSGLRASFVEAAQVRELFVGFGSCSVVEPLEGLQALGLAKESKI